MPKRTVDIAAPHTPDAKVAEAARAIAVFAGLCPELSIFANVLLGIDPGSRTEAIRVQPGSSTCTDGKTIFIRPDARLAGTRLSEDDWSDIKASLFHETAHIAFDSFAAIADEDRAAAIKHLTEVMPDSVRRDALLKHMEGEHANYRSLSTAFHGYMPMLVNALEDARVEACLFLAKPGTHKHLERQRMELFDAPRKVIAARIGTPWNERPEDDQAVIGCYILAAGYHVEGRLIETVARDLRSIEDLIIGAAMSTDVASLYASAFDVLSGLQSLGYLRNGDDRDAPVGTTDHPEDGAEDDSPEARAAVAGCIHPKDMIVECPNTECLGNCTLCGAHIMPAESEDGDGDGKPSDRPSKGEGGGEGDTKAKEDADGDPHDKRSDGAPRGAASSAPGGEHHPGDSSDGEDHAGAGKITDIREEERAAELNKAVSRAGGHTHHEDGEEHEHDDDHKHLDKRALERALTLHDSGYAVDEQPATGVTSIKRSEVLLSLEHPLVITPVDRDSVDGAIAQVMPELRAALALNGLSGWRGGQRAGRVDTRALYRTATGQDRVFGRFETPEERDYQFVFALDCSGSMTPTAMKQMKLAALAAMEMLSRLGVPFAAFGYSGDGYGSWGLEITMVRDIGQTWDDTTRKRLLSLMSYSANLDGSSMQYARILGRRAARTPFTEVIVLYFNDGGMPAENGYAEERLIRWEVANQRRLRTHYIGVGVQSTDVQAAGLELVACNSVSEGTRNITRKVSELLGVNR